MVTNELVTSAKEAVESKDAYTRTDTYDTEDKAPEGATIIMLLTILSRMG